MEAAMPSRPKLAAACWLAVLGAAAVIGVRLVAGASPVVPSPVPAAAVEREVPRASPKTVEQIRELMLPGKEAELARWMEERPAEVMATIDAMTTIERLADWETALKLTTAFVNSVQGMHYDLLLDWMVREKDTSLAAWIFRPLAARVIRENPDECIALAMGLGNTKDAIGARDEFFFALPLEKRRVLVDQLNPYERASLLSRRATGFAERDPDFCLDHLAKLPPSGERSEAMAKLMKAWANGANVFHLADPVSAVEGTMNLADPDLRREGLKLAVQEWADKNPDIASKWITKLPPGPDRDAAISGLVARLAPADPAAAAEWAAAISDEALRRKMTDKMGKPPAGKKEGEK